MNKVEDYIFIKNYLNDDQCQKLIRLCKDKAWSPHQWYNNQSENSKEGDTDCQVTWTDINIEDLLVPVMEQSIRDYQEKFAPKHKTLKRFITKMTKIRLNKYKANKDMKVHIDHIHSIFDGNDKGIPILSLVGLFNDDFEGGEFYVNNKQIEFNKGDIIIFPSNFMYPHEVKVITKGERYSYVAWAF